MTSRVLPKDEWDRLQATDFPAITPYVDDRDLTIIVVEDGEAIVGCWGLLPLLHLEGLWIAPHRRGGSGVARTLVNATGAEVRRRTNRWVMTGADTDLVRRLLTRHFHAILVPGEQYAIPVYGEGPCRFLR